MSSKKRVKQFIAYLLSICMVMSSLFFADVGAVQADGAKTTVYYYNSAGYNGLTVHWWVDGGGSSTWPGVATESVSGNWVKADIPSAPPFTVIISHNAHSHSDEDKVVQNVAITAEDVNASGEVYFAGSNKYKSKEDATAPKTTTLHFYDTDNWAAVKAYVYTASGTVTKTDESSFTGWPGDAIEKTGNGDYTIAVKSVGGNPTVIFNNAGNQKQTVNIPIEQTGVDNYFVLNKNASSTDNNSNTVYEVASYNTDNAAKAAATNTKKTVHFYNSAGYENVYAYAYATESTRKDDLLGGWPGTAAVVDSELGEGWYKADVPASSEFTVIFNNNNDKQTGDIAVSENNLYITADGQCYASAEEAESAVNGDSVTDVTLDKHNMYLRTGETGDLEAAIAPLTAGNKSVSWNSADPEVATISANGAGTAVVTAVGKGDAVITVTTEDGGFTDTCTVTVRDPSEVVSVNSVSLNSAELSLKQGKTGELSYTVDPEDANIETVSWNSANPAIAAVSSNGVDTKTATVTALGVGTTVITVSVNGIESNKCTVTVSETKEDEDATTVYFYNDQKWAEVSVHAWDDSENYTGGSWPGKPAERATDIGEDWWKYTVPKKAPFYIIFNDNDNGHKSGDGTLIENKTNVYVNSLGSTYSSAAAAKAAAPAYEEGTPVDSYTIHFYNDAGWTGVWAYSYLGKQEPSGAWPGTKLTFENDGWATLILSAEGMTTRNLPNVIFHNNAGEGNPEDKRVTKALAAGENGYYFTSSGNVYETKAAANAAVGNTTVPVTGVTVTPSTLELILGEKETEQLTAVVAPTGATNPAVTWSSGSPAVARVDQSGNVTAVAVGTATITVTTEDGGYTGTCAVEVKAKQESGGTTDTQQGGTTTQPGSDTQQGGTTQTQPGSDTQQGGTTDTQQGGTETPAKVAVTKITIKGESKKIAAGKKITLKANVTPEGATDKSVTWSTSNKKYATVTAKGVVTTKKAGAGKSVTITATAKDGSGVKATYKITIMKKAVTRIKLKASAKTVKAGKKVTVKATVTPASAKQANKTLAWKSSNTKYATVSKSGVVTTKKAGKGKKVTITATATDGSGKKASVTIKIK